MDHPLSWLSIVFLLFAGLGPVHAHVHSILVPAPGIQVETDRIPFWGPAQNFGMVVAGCKALLLRKDLADESLKYWSRMAGTVPFQTITQFLELGGEGDVFNFGKFDEGATSETLGPHLRVRALPTEAGEAKPFLFLMDGETRQGVSRLLSEGTPVFLGGYSSELGAVLDPTQSGFLKAYARHSKILPRASLVISPWTTRFILAHEQVHLDDVLRGFSTRLESEFQQLAGPVAAHISEMGDLVQFIKERRGYGGEALQLQAALIGGLEHQWVLDKDLQASKVDFPIFYSAEMASIVAHLNRPYAHFAHKALVSLRARDRDKYTLVLKRISELALPGVEQFPALSLSALLPEHFK